MSQDLIAILEDGLAPRGLLLGRSGDDRYGRTVYWVGTGAGVSRFSRAPDGILAEGEAPCHPLRLFDGCCIAADGCGADAIRAALLEGAPPEEAMRSLPPDGVAGLIDEEGAVTLALNGDLWRWAAPEPGRGLLLTPTMTEPVEVSVTGEFLPYIQSLWDALDGPDRLALCGCDLALDSGEARQYVFNEDENQTD